MMKLVFALLLCGFSASLASPTCSETEANKCNSGADVDKYPTTQEGLEKLCRAVLPSLDCTLRFIRRCPNTLEGAFHVSTRMTRDLYGKICEKNNPFGAMFLAKSQCLEKEEFGIERRCEEKVTIQDYCEKIDPVQKCITEELNRVCGSGAEELFAEFDKIKRAIKNVFCIKE